MGYVFHMVPLSKLAAMPPEERAGALSTLTGAPNGGVAVVERQIRELERRYEMSSDTMRERVRRGEIDTADTSRWLVLLVARGR